MESHSKLIDRVQKVHCTELVQLSTTRGRRRVSRPGIFSMVKQYFCYLANTWSRVFRDLIFLSLNPIDFLVVFTFALGCSGILGIFLLVCIIMKLRCSNRLLDNWSRKYNQGISITNAPGNLFRNVTQMQVDAARAALEQPPMEPQRRGERHFNVDVAKLLLQFSALMYERGTGPVLDALVAGHAHGVRPPTTEAKTANSKTPSPSSILHDLVHHENDSLSPTQLLADLVGAPAAEAIDERLSNNAKDGAIRDFCRTFGIDYAPVSELNGSDSAYTALFWDPGANWIVVAFKGTSPAEYAEWVSDFNYALVDACDWLPGFSLVHGIKKLISESQHLILLTGGFLGRIFPDDVSETGGIRPWDAITAGIKIISNNLRQRDPDTKINLYFTGHSLGCAIASLGYARAALVEKDLGEHVILRDGYLFAAPIVCDVASVKAFDGMINQDFTMPKTLWRITNMKDIVATGLPDFGDKKNSRFLYNSLLNFAHLGAEIKMRSKPVTSQVAGWPHITRGVPVLVTSNLPEDLVGTLGVHEGLSSSLLKLQELPLVGRFFQHATNFYWDQLQRMGVGHLDWVQTV